MALSHGNTSYTSPELMDRPDIPPIKGDEGDSGHASDLRRFLNYQGTYSTSKRAELERLWNKAQLYFAGRQWLRPRTSLGGQRLWYTWEQIRAPRNALFPMPVRNIFSAAVQDEKSRLIGVGTRPYVRADDDEAEDAALLSKQVLQDHNEKTGWDRRNRQGCFQSALFGQWIHTWRWEIDLLKMQKFAPSGAVKCPKCDDFSLVSADVDAKGASALVSGVERVGEKGYAAKQCPNCGSELEPFAPPEAMWQGDTKDRLDRPMRREEPTGKLVDEVNSPYGFFPMNQGIGYETDDEMEECLIRTPRTIPWLRTHYRNGKLVEQDRNWAAFQHYPIVLGHHGSMMLNASGVWANHNMEDVYIGQPCLDFPRGRVIAMAGDVILFDGELFIEGTEIPRYDVRVARWEPRENEIWGKPQSEDLFSIQNNINAVMAQGMDIMQKWVSPKMLLSAGMTMDRAGQHNDRYAADVWTVDTRGIPPEDKAKYPFIMSQSGAPGSMWQMFEADAEMAKEVSGTRDVETGNVSGSELNYSALLFAAQRAAQRRKPRTDEIRDLKRKGWSAALSILAWSTTDEEAIKIKDDKDRWKILRFRGLQIKGQTDVALEDEPVVDTGVAKRASIEQGMTWGTIKTSQTGGSYQADRRINREIGVPEELNADRNAQDDLASGEWHVYITEAIDPSFDRYTHDSVIHLKRHIGDFMDSREARDLRDRTKEAGMPWERVTRLTNRWEEMLSTLQGYQEMVRSAPPVDKMADLMLPGEAALQAAEDEMGPEKATMMLEEGKKRLMEARANLAKMAAAINGFPEVLELQIYHVWQRLLTVAEARSGEQSALGQDGALTPPLRILVRFYSHILAHLLEMKGGAQAPPPMLAAPGGAGGADPASVGGPGAVEGQMPAGEMPDGSAQVTPSTA